MRKEKVQGLNEKNGWEKRRDEGREGMREEKVRGEETGWGKRWDEEREGMNEKKGWGKRWNEGGGGGQTNEGEWGLKKGRRWSLSANKPVWYNMSDITSDK